MLFNKENRYNHFSFTPWLLLSWHHVKTHYIGTLTKFHFNRCLAYTGHFVKTNTFVAGDNDTNLFPVDIWNQDGLTLTHIMTKLV